MKKPIKAGFLSRQNYLDKNTFSGTLYYMYQALASKGVEMVDLKKPQAQGRIGKGISRALSKVQLGSGKSASELNEFKRQVEQSLEKKKCDVIFAPVASGEVDLIETSVPIVFSSDATPRLIYNDYYKIYPDEASFAAASATEKRVVAKAQKLVYPSRWSAESAVQDYGAAPGQVSVTPFGANLDFVPELDRVRARLSSSRCRLLFIGKDWQRKGGNLAFESLVKLLDAGIDAELTMIGCIPPEDAVAQVDSDRLTVIPFLNKNVKRERDRLYQIFLDAHFFLFPTRADCSPIVLCESAAFGLPVMSSNVGGIPTIVQEGVNGYTFSPDAGADQYADKMAAVFSEKDAYEQLVLSSRSTYEERLNWHAWADHVRSVMLELL